MRPNNFDPCAVLDSQFFCALCHCLHSHGNCACTVPFDFVVGHWQEPAETVGGFSSAQLRHLAPSSEDSERTRKDVSMVAYCAAPLTTRLGTKSACPAPLAPHQKGLLVFFFIACFPSVKRGVFCGFRAKFMIRSTIIDGCKWGNKPALHWHGPFR